MPLGVVKPPKICYNGFINLLKKTMTKSYLLPSGKTVRTFRTEEGAFLEILDTEGKLLDTDEIQGGSLELSQQFLNYLDNLY